MLRMCSQRVRIALPTSCSGFAITILGDIAQAAFLGTWAKIGLQVAECEKHVAMLHVNQISGLRETYASLRTELGDVIMERLPALESILLISMGGTPTGSMSKTARKDVGARTG